MKLDKFELANVRTPNFQNELLNNFDNIIFYGDNNLYPQEILFMSNNSVTHSACLGVKTMAIGGNGFATTTPKAKQFLDSFDYETDNSTILQKISASMGIFEGFAIEVIWNTKGDKIASIQFLDFEKLRVCKPESSDRSGRITFYKYNNDWTNHANNFCILSTFDPKLAKQYPNQVLYCFLPNLVSKFYPIPRYTSAINYIYNEYELSKHHLSSTTNGFLPSSLVTFVGNPTPEERDKNSKLFLRNTTGSENTGKVIVNYVEDIIYKPSIESLSTNNAVDYYINSEQTSKQKIITAHKMYSPALIADSDSNTSLFSNGEELKTIWNVFYNTEIARYQYLIEKNMSMILKYAGFKNEKYTILPFSLTDTQVQTEETVDTTDTETAPTDTSTTLRSNFNFDKLQNNIE